MTDKLSMTDRYARAVETSSMMSRPETTYSDSDVLGAYGLASKPWITDADGSRRRGSPLGVALLRMFVGDQRSADGVVEILARMAVGKAHRLGSQVRNVEAMDIARTVLDWHRNGTCAACDGHGVHVIAGTRTLGDQQCDFCHGTGKLLFCKLFKAARRSLAEWLLAEIEREQSIAGPAAMRMLAPRFNL